jgi:hypothetical protein
MRTADRARMKYSITNGGILVAIVALLLWFAPAATGADEVGVELKTRTATYTNVTVAGKSGTNVYIKHAGGISNLKIGELAPDAKQSLGYAVAKSAIDETGAGSNALRIRRRVGESTPFIEVEFANGINFQAGDWEIQLGYAALAGIALGYLLFCCCARLLCNKTRTEPGILIWFPILQMFPLLRAAGMSGWWFLALFVPVLNLVAWMGWCVNIVITRRKSLWWALLLILPLTSVTAFLYLALAKED